MGAQGGSLGPDLSLIGLTRSREALVTALREAGEEVGLNPGEAEILGYLPLYFTGTN